MTSHNPVPSLGDDLRALRKARGMTLSDVAAALDCSVGWLSQVERGQSSAGIEALKALAKLYDVPVSLFFGTPPARAGESGRILRAADRRVLGTEIDGLTEALLSPDLTDDFEVLHCRFAPHSRSERQIQRATQEVAVVIEGALRLAIDGQSFDIGLGDSFRLRGEAYGWENPHPTPATAIWVISPPAY